MLRRYRSVRYRIRETLRPTALSVADVEGALRESGLEPGDSCFVQSAMSAFGSFDEGPQTVLEAFGRVLGPSGLLAMPSYPLRAPAIEYLGDDPVFDVRSTPSRMGAISEVFRRSSDTLRSVHPTHPTCARGPGAAEIVAGHETADTPFGEGTPFPRIRDRDALQLFFGAGTAAITMYHSFECTRQPPFPLDVFADRVFEARCRDPEGRELLVRTLVHNPALHPGRIDVNLGLQSAYRQAILDAGGRSVRLGRGEILAIRMSALFEVFEHLLTERGVTIYDVPVPSTPPDRPPQERVAA
jgi:aminoglycoside 3-N-acetyltransferase